MTNTKAAHTPGLTVKSPVPARFPAYRIVSDADEVLAMVPITASGGSHKLAFVMAAAPDLLESLAELEGYMTDCGYFVKQEEMAKRARAAIRKAKGEA